MKSKRKSTSSKKKPAASAYKEPAPSKNQTLEEPAAAYAITPPVYGAEILKFLGGTKLFQSPVLSMQGRHDWISLIRKGISRLSLDHLMRFTGISTEEMASIMHTSDRTLRRYTADTLLNPEQTERAIELARLYSRGESVFGSLPHFKEWMDTDVPALGFKKPKAFLDTSLGISLLLDELGRIEHGIVA